MAIEVFSSDAFNPPNSHDFTISRLHNLTIFNDSCVQI